MKRWEKWFYGGLVAVTLMFVVLIMASVNEAEEQRRDNLAALVAEDRRVLDHIESLLEETRESQERAEVSREQFRSYVIRILEAVDADVSDLRAEVETIPTEPPAP